MSEYRVKEYSKSRILRIRLVVVCGAVAFFINIFVSNDWCFAATTTALFSSLLVFVIDVVLCKVASQSKATDYLRITLGAIVAVVLGFIIQLSDNKAFELVFETSPPDSVYDVHVDRKYMGGPGDHLLLMQFRTDAQTLDRLLLHRKFVEDVEVLQEWHDVFRDDRTVFEYVFGGLLQRRRSL